MVGHLQGTTVIVHLPNSESIKAKVPSHAPVDASAALAASRSASGMSTAFA